MIKTDGRKDFTSGAIHFQELSWIGNSFTLKPQRIKSSFKRIEGDTVLQIESHTRGKSPTEIGLSLAGKMIDTSDLPFVGLFLLDCTYEFKKHNLTPPADAVFASGLSKMIREVEGKYNFKILELLSVPGHFEAILSFSPSKRNWLGTRLDKIFRREIYAVRQGRHDLLRNQET